MLRPSHVQAKRVFIRVPAPKRKPFWLRLITRR